MNKELIINATPTGVEIALLEDKKLVELHNEKTDANFAVGDLYLGKVKKLIPGLNAAFVDVGFEKDAFLHYSDLSPYAKSIIKYTQAAMSDKSEHGFDFARFQSEPEIIKTGKINEVLNGKPNVLVQILKVPIAAKGPRLSCELFYNPLNGENGKQFTRIRYYAGVEVELDGPHSLELGYYYDQKIQVANPINRSIMNLSYSYGIGQSTKKEPTKTRGARFL